MKKEKILRDFVVHVHELADYWALAKIKSIHGGCDVRDYTPEEYELMQKLIEDKPTRMALEKLLYDCGRGNIFSLLVYIDGGEGVKSLEIVNAETGEPIAEDTLHEHLADWVWGNEWATMMKKVAKSKKLVEKSFKERPLFHI